MHGRTSLLHAERPIDAFILAMMRILASLSVAKATGSRIKLLPTPPFRKVTRNGRTAARHISSITQDKFHSQTYLCHLFSSHLDLLLRHLESKELFSFVQEAQRCV